jgi:hypothetical protein
VREISDSNASVEIAVEEEQKKRKQLGDEKAKWRAVDALAGAVSFIDPLLHNRTLVSVQKDL